MGSPRTASNASTGFEESMGTRSTLSTLSARSKSAASESYSSRLKASLHWTAMSTSESARARPLAWEPKSQAASTLGRFLKTSSATCSDASLSTVSENLVSEAVEVLAMIVCDVYQNLWVQAALESTPDNPIGRQTLRGELPQ